MLYVCASNHQFQRTNCEDLNSVFVHSIYICVLSVVCLNHRNFATTSFTTAGPSKLFIHIYINRVYTSAKWKVTTFDVTKNTNNYIAEEKSVTIINLARYLPSPSYTISEFCIGKRVENAYRKVKNYPYHIKIFVDLCQNRKHIKQFGCELCDFVISISSNPDQLIRV